MVSLVARPGKIFSDDFCIDDLEATLDAAVLIDVIYRLRRSAPVFLLGLDGDGFAAVLDYDWMYVVVSE